MISINTTELHKAIRSLQIDIFKLKAQNIHLKNPLLLSKPRFKVDKDNLSATFEILTCREDFFKNFPNILTTSFTPQTPWDYGASSKQQIFLTINEQSINEMFEL